MVLKTFHQTFHINEFIFTCVPGILNSIVGGQTEEVSVTSEEALLSLKQLYLQGEKRGQRM